MSWKIPLSDLDFSQEEFSAVQDVLHSQWLTMGAKTQEFESACQTYLKTAYAIAVSNGTAALHMACMALDLGPGDEVIVPSLTFVATANAVRYTGATPVFADISSERDLNISPDDIELRITKHTRAIIVVHYGGYACDMVHIMELAREHDLYVIEDAAHAIGSELIERRLGTWGDIGCFSFFSNKNLTTGEGGLVVTAQVEIAEKLRLLRSHGMTSLTWDRHRGHAWSYDVVALGYNYRIDEIRAALGLVQLGKLDQYNARRRHLTQQYYSLLHELTPNIIIPFESHPGLSAAHIMPVLLPKGHDRHRLMEQMKAHGIQTSIHYPPIHTFTAYKNQDRPDNFHLPLTDDIATREITLPLYPALTEEDIATVVFAARDALLN